MTPEFKTATQNLITQIESQVSTNPDFPGIRAKAASDLKALLVCMAEIDNARESGDTAREIAAMDAATQMFASTMCGVTLCLAFLGDELNRIRNK